MSTRTPLFVEGRVGRLMKVEEHELSRYEFEIWFEYTRLAMAQVREGAMVAVPNFASHGNEHHLSILEITSLRPIHYALGENPDGYPGFVMEAARNASQDWASQEDRSEEDTTIIRCVAIPTNLELVMMPGTQSAFQPEANIPMVGADARLLDSSLTEQVVNRGISLEQESIATIGTLMRDENVRILLRAEDFVKVHFGVFGFTGVGKSNLVSTVVASVLPVIPNSKVILFDLMGEYGTLLIDRLNTLDNALIVSLGDRGLPQRVFDFVNSDPNSTTRPRMEEAARALLNFFLLPKALLEHRDALSSAYAQLLTRRKIRVFTELQNARVNDVCDRQSPRNPWRNRRPGRHSEAITQIVRVVFGGHFRANTPLTPQLAQELHAELTHQLSEPGNVDYQGDFEPALHYLSEILEGTGATIRCAITQDQILDMIDGDNQALLIVISNDPNELRRFSCRIGEAAYERRRRSGRIQPLVSFIFDEADEFIPQQASGSYEDSKRVAESLARRGRKFGLGLGIATQRIRHLDTSIMAQPHTYLVSKLPRKSDREAVAEAFGMSEEMLRQTFTFQAGNWLLVSHDATGLKAVPVPIYAQDANERIMRYLQTIRGQGRSRSS